jgi:carbon-monoxide dehydrogenase large subunit
MPPRPVLAWERVRFVGEPVAAVLSLDRYQAEDAAQLVTLVYEELPSVIDASVASGGPALHEGRPDNVLFEVERRAGDVDAARQQAAWTLVRTFRVHRHAGVPMETRGCMALVQNRRLTLWSSTQLPHLVRSFVAEALGWAEDRVEVVAPCIGGGFGVKGHAYPEEALVALLAVHIGRPVKWVEDRHEHMLAAVHARDHLYQAELSLDVDARILGLAATVTVDVGAYSVWPQSAALEAQMTATILPGPYDVPSYQCRARAVATNKSPFGTYRGVSRPGNTFALERLMDEAARETGLDPVDIRRRNLVQDFPHRTATGLRYPPASLRESLERAAAAVADERSAHSPANGALRGVGFACFIEQTGHVPPWARREAGVVVAPDSVQVSLDSAGCCTVHVGLNSHGQGHVTTLAQLVADELALTPDQVTVVAGDTRCTPYGLGTLASRAAVVAGGAAAAAARRLRERLLELGAEVLGVAQASVALTGGGVRAADGRMLQLAELIQPYGERQAPHGLPTLSAQADYDGPDQGRFSNACHAAVVELDPDSGLPRVVRYVVVEDCGKAINPLIVEGQVHGGVAQGIGGALLEELIYDRQGQLLTASFLDYLLPSAGEIPPIEVYHLATPDSDGLGVKGTGESGAIGPMAAIANAVADALGPGRAGRVLEVPLTPQRLWSILQGPDPGP